MSDQKKSLGATIDLVVDALTPFDDADRSLILSTICTHMRITPGSQTIPLSSDAGRLNPSKEITRTQEMSTEVRRPQSIVDIRALKEEKRPNSARQMACLVAFYLQEHAPEGETKESITTGDLEKYFKQAGYKLPKKLEQLLIDSKHAGYFESSGRGEYRLTRVGYNLVTHGMPPRTSE